MLLDRVPGRSVPDAGCHTDVLRCCLTYPLIVVLFAGLSVISTPVHANPPDSGDPPGIYDNDDHDDVVILLTDTVGLGFSLLASGKPECLFLGVASFGLPPAPLDASRLSFHLRSPPIS